MSSAYLGIKVVILCLFWYVTSAANNVVGKLVLQSFAYPTTVTLVQFLSITLYSIPALRCLPSARRIPHISWGYYFMLIIPLAFGKFFASVASHVSLGAVPVSYAHTVKASMPLFVVLLSRCLFGEKQTTKVYLSLIPIILGVAISSVTELEFNILGLTSALFSIFVLKDTSIHHLRLLHVLAKHALIMFIPFWVYHDLLDILYGQRNSSLDGWVIGGLLFVDGLCNFFQNVVAFTVLSLVTPLTYSVCNASKRIAVITCSILMLKNPVTPANIFGMGLAIFGVFFYNKAKIDARNEPILPTKTTKAITVSKGKINGIPRNKSDETNLLLRFVDSNDHISNAIVAPKSLSPYASSSYTPSFYSEPNGKSRHEPYNSGNHYRGHRSAQYSSLNGDAQNYTRLDMMDV
ncbi:hypothetical protein TYRP_008159 [Tyrophagus putrescentiae]|nr:hypothetical protein TYRP_008159 [Tyrophagus putrescentiae]